MQFKVIPEYKELLFNDFKNGVIVGVHRKWKKRRLYAPKHSKTYNLKGKNIYYNFYNDPFYYKSYPFTGGYGNYNLYYCHCKYKDDYILVQLQHSTISNLTPDEFYQNTLIFLESIGIGLDLLELENKLNRIDYKHDYECEYNPIAEKQAIMCICSIARMSFNGVYKESLKIGTGIKYKPKSSAIEVIVYDKYKEKQDKYRHRTKSSHIELEILNYENVFRTELRLKNKRLNYNKKNTLHINKTLNNYYSENISDECFKRYVEPIFYTAAFYRIDYAILAIQSDRRLTEVEVEKLCNLVKEINNKGFTIAKIQYKYSEDTFNKHIKLLRSIGINPLCFDENIEIPFLLNFTTKEVSRDFKSNIEDCQY